MEKTLKNDDKLFMAKVKVFGETFDEHIQSLC